MYILKQINDFKAEEAKIDMALFGKRQLFYSGCLYKHKLAEQLNLYKKILDKLGIKYKELDEEVCCGSALFELGYEEEARKLARKNLAVFRKEKIDKIITPDSACYKFFLQNYKEILPDWKETEIEHISVTILKQLLDKKKLIKNSKLGEHVIYHDNCWLKSCKITGEPRELLKLLGYELIELGGSCGGCGILNMTNPELAEKVSTSFFKQAEKAGINKIITMGECYSHLNKFKPAGVEVLELGEAVGYGLGIKNEQRK